jgi:hypothetical protein
MPAPSPPPAPAGALPAVLLVLALLVLALLTPLPAHAAGEPASLRLEPWDLDPRDPLRTAFGELELLGAWRLGSADPRFGGLSGLLVSADGGELVAVSDRGTLWRAALDHDAEGRLVAAGDLRAWPLRHAAFEPNGRRRDDAESLAWLPGGGIAVAFEQHHRLRYLPGGDPGATLLPLPTPADLARAPANEGVEALAALGDGSLLAIAEGLYDGPDLLAAWRIDGDRVERLAYRAARGFQPTGADRIGDLVLVLERRLSFLGGWHARITVVEESRIRPGAVLEGRELARLAAPLQLDNMEGIAVRPHDRGALIYLISDDNFHFLQRTLLLQLRWPEAQE